MHKHIYAFTHFVHLIIHNCWFQCDALNEEFNSIMKESNPPAQEPNRRGRWTPCSLAAGVCAHGAGVQLCNLVSLWPQLKIEGIPIEPQPSIP